MTIFVRVVQSVFAFLIVFLGALNYADRQNLEDGWALWLFDFLVAWRSVALIVLGLATFLGQMAVLALEGSIRQKAIQAVVDAARARYFVGEDESKLHKHRLTLFRCRRLWKRLFVGNYLAIYARAGKHGRSRTVLRVDCDRQEGCEGVAGRIYFLDATYTVSTRAWPADPIDIAGRQAYAADGMIPLVKAEALEVKSRAFSGATVRKGGVPWGVLLVDSLTRAPVTAEKEETLQFFADLIAKLVK